MRIYFSDVITMIYSLDFKDKAKLYKFDRDIMIIMIKTAFLCYHEVPDNELLGEGGCEEYHKNLFKAKIDQAYHYSSMLGKIKDDGNNADTVIDNVMFEMQEYYYQQAMKREKEAVVEKRRQQEIEKWSKK